MPLIRTIEEGTFIINFNGEVLNSKNEWHQPKIIKTTIIQGVAQGQARRFPTTGVHNVVVNSVENVTNEIVTSVAVAVREVTDPGTTKWSQGLWYS